MQDEKAWWLLARPGELNLAKLVTSLELSKNFAWREPVSCLGYRLKGLRGKRSLGCSSSTYEPWELSRVLNTCCTKFVMGTINLSLLPWILPLRFWTLLKSAIIPQPLSLSLTHHTLHLLQSKSITFVFLTNPTVPHSYHLLLGFKGRLKCSRHITWVRLVPDNVLFI